MRSLVLMFMSIGWACGQEAPKPEKLITIQQGDLPIIISAPHGGKTPIPDTPERKGDGIAKFVVVRDTNTDELAVKFAAAIEKEFGAKPFLVVAQFERKYCDVNRPADNAYENAKAKPYYDLYHQTLNDACKHIQKTWGRGLLLDIHGQAADAETIFRGTNNGQSVKALLDRYGNKALTGEKSILGQLAAKKYKVLPANDSDDKEDTRFNGGYIVQTYGSSKGHAIDAIQFEMGGTARAKAKLEQTATDMAAAVKVFAKEYLPEKAKK